MQISVLVLTADTDLGKVDFASMSQQNLMELFIENMDDSEKDEL